MTTPRRRALMAYGLAIAIIILDQAVKYWVVDGLRLPLGGSIAWWGPVRLTLVRNPGISFGFFQGEADWTRWALTLFALLVTGVLAWWARRPDRTLTALMLGCLMGGATGNMIDRITRGSVVDFIDVQFLHFPWIFNIADAAINVGMALWLFETLVTPRPARA